MRREEDPDTSPQKRGLCCQHRRRAGGILAGVAAVLAVSVVLILGGEELNAIAGGSAQVNVSWWCQPVLPKFSSPHMRALHPVMLPNARSPAPRPSYKPTMICYLTASKT